MSSSITELLKESIYPNLDAVKEGLLDHLHPRRSGKAYMLDCPVCQARGRAYYYAGGSSIVCNRQNNCGAVTSVWDALQQTGMSPRESLQVMADAAGVRLPESGRDNEPTTEKIKSVLRYGLSKSKKAQEYLLNIRGWSEEEIEKAPFGYIHDMEYFVGGLRRRGVDDAELRRFGIEEAFSNPKTRSMLERALVGWWEQADGTLRLWARDITGEKPVKYYFQPGMSKDLPCFWNEAINRRATDHIILVEGVLDAARLIVNGVSAVAIGGASMPEKQAVTLSSRVSSFTHWIDADEAGAKGGVQTIIRAAKYGVYGAVFRLPDDVSAKDADEAIGKCGIDSVIDMIESGARGGGRFLADRLVEDIRSGASDLLALYESARRVALQINGPTYTEFMSSLKAMGVEIESPYSAALRALANLVDAGLDINEASALIRRKHAIEINVKPMDI